MNLLRTPLLCICILQVVFGPELKAQQLRPEISQYKALIISAPIDFGYKNGYTFKLVLDSRGLRQGPAELLTFTKNRELVTVFKGTWKNDILVDTAYWYYEDGSMKRRAFFEDNKANAKALPWPDSRMLGNGALQGELTTWVNDKNGTKYSSIMNYVNGVKTGEEIIFWNNSQVFARVNYENGVRSGKEIFYDQNGKTVMEGTNKNDKKEGKWTTYYNTGERYSDINYRDGIQQDSAVFYHPNGKFQKVELYRSGKKQGDFREYDSSGRLIRYCHYDNFSNLDSVEIYYYPNGQMKQRGQMKNDLRNGTFSAWHENGKLAETGQCIHDTPTGIWVYYDEKGKQIRKQDYGKVQQAIYREDRDGEGVYTRVVEEEAELVFNPGLVLPVIQLFNDTVDIPQSNQIKFSRKLKYIEMHAHVSTRGSLHFYNVSPLPSKQKKQLLDWLNANYNSAEPLLFNGEEQTCDVYFRLYLEKPKK